MEQNTKTILVVDDEKDLADAVATALTREGYKVLTADNGQTGIDMALEHKPDLIFLDVVMPEVTGVEVLEKLRKDAWGKDVPIIVMTVLSDMEKIADVIAAGANAHIIKSDLDLFELVDLAKQRLAA